MDDRRRLTARELRVAEEVEAVLYRHDPIGIAFGDNPDEYAPEAGTIALRLWDAGTVDDVRRIVHEECVRWFGADSAGPAADYQAIAEEIWPLLRIGPSG